MASTASLEPRWLVDLLSRWAFRDAKAMSGALGYPTRSAFTVQRADGTRWADPTGYSVDELDEIEALVHSLMLERPELFAAVSMYYRPWTVTALRQHGYPFGAGNATYYRRLHEAHRWMAARMPEKAPKNSATGG